MSRLRLLPYLGSLLLLIAVIAIVLSLLVVPGSLFPVLLAGAILTGVAGVLCVVFGLLLPKFERNAIPSADILGAATAAGRVAPARVVSARLTGISIGMTWEFAADLVVAATDRPAYRGIQYIRAPYRWEGASGTAPIITVVRVEAGEPRGVMVKDVDGTDQSQKVPQTAPGWND
jgi:hypothetical protein